MGKKRNEVNGVLVYRRWCAGAILSAFFLLIVIVVPVAFGFYKWISFDIPSNSVTSLTSVQSSGMDLVKNVLKRDFDLKTLLGDIGGAANVSPKYFSLIMRFSLYGMLGFLGLLAIFGIVELFYFIFYAITGRVVNPAGPVKLAWTIFAFSLIYAILSLGLCILIARGYASATGTAFSWTLFFLNPLPFIGPHSGFVANYLWPFYYTMIALVGAIIISIIYTAAFKDKFFIGRAKRFGSGEVDQPVVAGSNTTTYYPASSGGTQIITTAAPQPVAANGQQPQVIVVNSTPSTAPQSAPIFIPGQQPQPVVQVIGPGGQQMTVPPQQPVVNEAGEVVAQPVSVLPADIKSIGGHAFSKNLDLKYADVPSGIKELGVGAFANCLNLEVVSLPKSVKRIKKNCFFNCVKLTRINYAGTKSEWRYIVRGSNWLDRAGTRTVICSDGAIIVDPHR